jgi:PBP1b-binding outer membrane lipoprotein LpoB
MLLLGTGAALLLAGCEVTTPAVAVAPAPTVATVVPPATTVTTAPAPVVVQPAPAPSTVVVQ